MRKLAPEDVEVHLVQLFCLIQLHQYDAALKLMDENSQFRGETTLQVQREYTSTFALFLFRVSQQRVVLPICNEELTRPCDSGVST